MYEEKKQLTDMYSLTVTTQKLYHLQILAQYYTHQPQKNLKSLTQPGNQQTICQALCYVQI